MESEADVKKIKVEDKGPSVTSDEMDNKENKCVQIKCENLNDCSINMEQDCDPDMNSELLTKSRINSLKELGPFIASKDNAQNTVYFSQVPEVCKREPCMLGVDEAGRGPVLGPMVYGIAYCPLKSKQTLNDLGCADSKQLTEEIREKIFDEMNTGGVPLSCFGWAVELISPNVISSSMLRRSKCSLNEVSMNSAIGLIQRAVEEGVDIAEVYVDTVGPPEKYQEKLKKIFPQFKITVAKKADSTYPIVSAASICAKVTRDNALKVWKFPEGLELTSADFGSGYPGDPVTKRFLTENIDNVFGFPRLVRFSWSTAENALADTSYNMEFDEPDNEKQKYKGPKLTQFFKGTTKTGEVQRKPCRFFKERCIKNVSEF